MSSKLGFIPFTYHDAQLDAGDEEVLHTLGEVWRARQLAETLELGQILKSAHDAAFKEVQRYADLLGCLSPTDHNAAQEVGCIAVMLSNAETPEDRLHILTTEMRRLMMAVAEAKRQHRSWNKLRAKFHPLVPYLKAILLGLLGGLFGLVYGLTAEGMLF